MRKRRCPCRVAICSSASCSSPPSPSLPPPSLPSLPHASTKRPAITSSPSAPASTDVSPHQLVRTSADFLYTVAPTCDAYPVCPNNSLRAYRADQSGTPASFAEQDSAHRPTNVGSAAIAIDGTDTIHVLFNDRSGALTYATFATATDRWSTTLPSPQPTGPTSARAMRASPSPSTATACPMPSGTATGSDGVFTPFTPIRAAAGVPSEVDDIPLSNNRRALHPTIAFKADNTLVVAWLEGTFNYTPDGIIRVRPRTVNGNWGATATINDPTGAMTTIDNGPSLLVTPDGTIHLTFIAANPADQVRYWYNRGAGWQGDQQPPVQVTHDPSLGPDGNGGVLLYGHGTPEPTYQDHGENLYQFHKGAGATAWEPWTLYVTGSYDSSVTTRWAQFFQAHPEEVDIAYWGDAYPNQLYVGTDGGSGGTPPSPSPTMTATSTPTLAPTPTSTPIPPTPTSTSAPATATPTLAATPTPTSAATATPAPTSVSTATATPGSGGTISMQIAASGDDVTEDGTTYDRTAATVWMGTGGAATASYTGLRFTGIAIPPHATITSAYVNVVSSQTQWNSYSMAIAADATGNSPAFTSGNRPSQRTLTTASVMHDDDVQWLANTTYALDDVSAVIQEIINRPDWASGNALSVIMTGTGGAYARKFVTSFDGGGSTNAPRLVVTFTASGGATTATPTATATSMPTPTNTPTPTPTNTPTPTRPSPPSGQFVQDASQFTQGSASGLTIGVDGSLSLIPAFADDFPGTSLNSANWSTTQWSPGGAASVSNSAVSVDGVGLGTAQSYTQRSFEARALFTAGPPAFQNLGWSPDLNGSQWILFGEPSFDSAHIYARVATGSGSEQLVQLPVTLGVYHTYRIDWGGPVPSTSRSTAP